MEQYLWLFSFVVLSLSNRVLYYSKQERFSLRAENEQADAGRDDGRTRLTKPNSQRLTRTGKKSFFPVHLTTSRIGNLLARLVHTLATSYIICDDRTGSTIFSGTRSSCCLPKSQHRACLKKNLNAVGSAILRSVCYYHYVTTIIVYQVLVCIINDILRGKMFVECFPLTAGGCLEGLDTFIIFLKPYLTYIVPTGPFLRTAVEKTSKKQTRYFLLIFPR